MLSSIEIKQQEAEQLPLKSTVSVDFKILFSHSLHIKTCFANKVEGIIILTLPFMQLLRGLLKVATWLMQDWITILKYSHLNKKRIKEVFVCIWNLSWI